MLQVRTENKLDRVETTLRNAAQHHGASVLSVTHLGHLLREKEPPGAQDAIVFTVCHPNLSAALLSADIRFAAFVPCRVAAFELEGAVTLVAMSPAEICRMIDRPDLAELAGRMEAAIAEIIEEAGRPLAVHAPHASRHLSVGATEEQVYARGMIPQRIDCRGTKVEELAGTGEHDSSGG